jgi:hypothetical protein
LDGDPPERRLRAVAPRRAEDRRREDLTDVFRMAWEHGVNGQAQVIKGMQQIIHSYTLLQDKEAMSEAVANVRWLIAAGIRESRRCWRSWASFRRAYPATPQHPTSPPTTTRLPGRGDRPNRGLGAGRARTPAARFVAGTPWGLGARRDEEWAPP